MLWAASAFAAVTMAAKGSYTLLNTPISADLPPGDVFMPTTALNSWLPPRFLGAATVGFKPVPTNNWWANMIAASTDPLVQPVWTLPYAFRPILAAFPFGLSVNYPISSRAYGGTTGNDQGINEYYTHSPVNDWVFTAQEFTSAPAFHVNSWDDLSVSMRFSRTYAATLDATLVPGMAYVTAKYSRLTPCFTTAHVIVSINGLATSLGASTTGNRFLVTLSNSQSWVFYFSADVKVSLSGSSTLAASAAFTGYVRAAIVTSDAHVVGECSFYDLSHPSLALRSYLDV